MEYVYVVTSHETGKILFIGSRKYDCVDRCAGIGVRPKTKPDPQDLVHRHVCVEAHSKDVDPVYLGTVEEFLKKERL